MKVSECMSKSVEICTPNDTIRGVAGLMREIDAGSIPVSEDDRLVGMITDRDIAIRAVGEGLGPETPVRQIMSTDVRWCFDDEELDEVADKMADQKIRRLPVVSREKRLVGIVSLGDVSQSGNSGSGEALREISEPGGLHSH